MNCPYCNSEDISEGTCYDCGRKLPDTYHKVCEDLAEWITSGSKGKIKISGKEVFELDPQGHLFHIHDLKDYKEAGLSILDVVCGNEYIARLMLRFMCQPTTVVDAPKH